jgi:hypothetical protein
VTVKLQHYIKMKKKLLKKKHWMSIQLVRSRCEDPHLHGSSPPPAVCQCEDACDDGKLLAGTITVEGLTVNRGPERTRPTRSTLGECGDSIRLGGLGGLCRRTGGASQHWPTQALVYLPCINTEIITINVAQWLLHGILITHKYT